MQLLNVQIDSQWKHFSVLKLEFILLALTNHLKRYALLQVSIRYNTGIAMPSCLAKKLNYLLE